MDEYAIGFQALFMMIVSNIEILQIPFSEKPEKLEFIERAITKRIQQGPQGSTQGATGTAFHVPLSCLHELRLNYVDTQGTEQVDHFQHFLDIPTVRACHGWQLAYTCDHRSELTETRRTAYRTTPPSAGNSSTRGGPRSFFLSA